MFKDDSIKLFKESAQFLPKVVELKSITCDEANSLLIDKAFFKTKFYSNTYILIRVITGFVRIVMKTKVKELRQGNIIISQAKSIDEIFSNNGNIRIFIFTCSKSPVHFKLDTHYNVAFDDYEDKIVMKMLSQDNDSKYTNAFVDHLFAVLYMQLIENHTIKSYNTNIYSKEVSLAVKYIDDNLAEKISFTDISKKYNLSERTFRKAFNDIMGISPKTYQQNARLNLAATKLKDENITISEVSDELGFYSQFHFSKDFKKHFGITPSEYKKHCK